MFDELSDEEQREYVQSMAVFARVEPSHKTALVGMLKAAGEVAAPSPVSASPAPRTRRCVLI